MDVELFLNKTVDENAALYYEKSKKSKKKLEGIKTAIVDSKKKLDEVQNQHDEIIAREEETLQAKANKTILKKEWYEKFRWTYTSLGKLVIGGKDATTNELVIKKHTEEADLVFHTDMAGSPFMVIKYDGNPIEPIEIEETAQFLACYSRAWKLGLSTADVFYVKSEQVTKETKAGESISKGAFMIYGKTTYVHPTLKLAITVIDDKVYAGAGTAIKALLKKENPDISECELVKQFVVVVQGTTKTSQMAKDIKVKLCSGELDDYVRVLPSGGTRLQK